MLFKECKERDIAQINEWFKQCEKQDQPYVLCLNRTTYSKVQWDFINLSHEKAEKLLTNEEWVRKGLIDIFNRYANKKSTYQFSVQVGYMDTLDQHNAAAAAEEVAKLLREGVGFN